jgi:hypothetical protein
LAARSTSVLAAKRVEMIFKVFLRVWPIGRLVRVERRLIALDR